MFFVLAVLAMLPTAISVWLVYGRPKRGFLPDFAKLLDRPEFVNGFENRLIKRSFLKGEFRGRKVVVLLQRGRRRGKYSPRIVVSMETRSRATIESYEFVGDRSDRESALALFALEVTHQVRLRHEDGCLKALRDGGSSWPSLFNLPPRFDPTMWRSVLEAMHTLAGSLEQRAA